MRSESTKNRPTSPKVDEKMVSHIDNYTDKGLVNNHETILQVKADLRFTAPVAALRYSQRLMTMKENGS